MTQKKKNRFIRSFSDTVLFNNKEAFRFSINRKLNLKSKENKSISTKENQPEIDNTTQKMPLTPPRSQSVLDSPETHIENEIHIENYDATLEKESFAKETILAQEVPTDNNVTLEISKQPSLVNELNLNSKSQKLVEENSNSDSATLENYNLSAAFQSVLMQEESTEQIVNTENSEKNLENLEKNLENSEKNLENSDSW